jgi:hypothetical protein
VLLQDLAQSNRLAALVFFLLSLMCAGRDRSAAPSRFRAFASSASSVAL